MFGAICAPGFLVGVGRMKVEAREDAREEERRLNLRFVLAFPAIKRSLPVVIHNQDSLISRYIAVFLNGQ
jgi:hypothetical protein